MTRGVRVLGVGLTTVALVTCCAREQTVTPVVENGSAPADPESVVSVESGSFQVVYRLDGVTASSGFVGIDVAPGTSFLARPRLPEQVQAGQVLGRLKPLSTDTESGTVARSQALAAQDAAGDVRAAVSGRLSIAPRLGIHREGIDVVVALKPLQELRYRGLRFRGAATVETVLGQRTVPCVTLWIESLAAAAPDPLDADSGAAAQSAVHCRLADSVETAAGLRSGLTLTSPELLDVVALPVAAVSLDENGRDYVVTLRGTGKTAQRPIVVGVTDGVRRVVVSGLRPGEQVVVP